MVPSTMVGGNMAVPWGNPLYQYFIFSILGEKPATNKLPYFPMNISLTENSSLKSELFAQFLLDLRLLFKDSHKLY